MEDLSSHVLDVVENSIEAGAQKIEIKICENVKADRLEIEITDDGKGMDAQTLEKSLDPFFTTKTVRKVGLGLSLFKEAARKANGDLCIQSDVGRGTRIIATFQHSHIDRQPLGDMKKTITTLIVAHPEIQFRYSYRKDGRTYGLNSQKLGTKRELSSLSTVELIHRVKKNLEKIPQP